MSDGVEQPQEETFNFIVDEFEKIGSPKNKASKYIPRLYAALVREGMEPVLAKKTIQSEPKFPWSEGTVRKNISDPRAKNQALANAARANLSKSLHKKNKVEELTQADIENEYDKAKENVYEKAIKIMDESEPEQPPEI